MHVAMAISSIFYTTYTHGISDPAVSDLTLAPSDSDSRNRGSSSPRCDGPAPSSVATRALFTLCGAPPTVHFILERTQCLQLQALPGGGHLQVRTALAQLLQVGLEPDGLLAHFFPCETG